MSETDARRLINSFENNFTLVLWHDFFVRSWKKILAASLITALLAFMLSLMVSPRYTAASEVLLEPGNEKVVFGKDQTVSDVNVNIDSGSIDSQIPIIESFNVLVQVVNEQKLAEDPEFNGKSISLLTYLSRSIRGQDALSVTQKLVNMSGAKDSSVSTIAAVNNLRRVISVERIKKSFVFRIAVTSLDKDKAVRLANSLARAYVNDRIQARYEIAHQADLFLSSRINELQSQVRASEEAVEKFRHDNNLQTTSSEGKLTITDQQLSELNAKLIVAHAETAEKKAKYTQAEEVLKRHGDVSSIPEVLRSAAISNLREQQAEVSRKEADLAARFSGRHPSLINARAELDDINRSIASEINRIIVNLKNDYDIASSSEKSLESSIQRLVGGGGNEPNGVTVKLRELERANEANKAIFESFLTKSKVAKERTNFEQSEIRIISPAVPPDAPSFPKKTLWCSLGSLIGILLGVIGCYAHDGLSPGFTSVAEIEKATGVSVLTTISKLSKTERTVNNEVLDPVQYLQHNPFSRFAESMRSIRHGVGLSNEGSPERVVMVTSSLKGEGKSTITRSLAYSAVSGGKSVLLVDADLRNPSTSSFFGSTRGLGLTDLLSGQAELKDVVYNVDKNLTIIGAGKKNEQLTDLLSSLEMRNFIESEKHNYDLVLIDTPPVQVAVDTQLIGSLADQIIFVVAWKVTPRDLVIKFANRFSQTKRLGGIVLNMIDESKMSRIGNEGYYGSSYSYDGYYEKPNK